MKETIFAKLVKKIYCSETKREQFFLLLCICWDIPIMFKRLFWQLLESQFGTPYEQQKRGQHTYNKKTTDI